MNASYEDKRKSILKYGAQKHAKLTTDSTT